MRDTKAVSGTVSGLRGFIPVGKRDWERILCHGSMEEVRLNSA